MMPARQLKINLSDPQQLKEKFASKFIAVGTHGYQNANFYYEGKNFPLLHHSGPRWRKRPIVNLTASLARNSQRFDFFALLFWD